MKSENFNNLKNALSVSVCLSLSVSASLFLSPSFSPPFPRPPRPPHSLSLSFARSLIVARGGHPSVTTFITLAKFNSPRRHFGGREEYANRLTATGPQHQSHKPPTSQPQAQAKLSPFS